MSRLLPAPVSLGVEFGVPYPDAAPLSECDSAALRGHAERIRGHMRNAYVAIGRELIAAKQLLGHGTWHTWLKSEFGYTPRTASSYMAAARLIEGKSETVADLPPTVLYALASSPPQVKAALLQRAESGEQITADQVKDEAREAKAIAEAEAARCATRKAKLAPEELAAEAKREHTRERREAKADQQLREQRALEVAADKAAAEFLRANLSAAQCEEFVELMRGRHWPHVARLLLHDVDEHDIAVETRLMVEHDPR